MRVRKEIRRRAAHRLLRRLVEIACDAEEALGAEEPAIGEARQPGGAERLAERGAARLERPRVVERHVALAATGLIEAGKGRDAFEDGRFAGAVLSDDDRDRTLEGELEI